MEPVCCTRNTHVRTSRGAVTSSDTGGRRDSDRIQSAESICFRGGVPGAREKTDSCTGCDVYKWSNDEAWMLDSGSSFHVTYKKELFTSYKSGELGFVYLGDDTTHRVVGVGDIKFKMHDRVERMLQGVMHVSGLRRNLISLGALHDGGMSFRADQDSKTMIIMKGKETVMM